MPISILNVPRRHPLNRLSDLLKQRLVSAQTHLLEGDFRNSYELCERVLSDLKIAMKPARDLADRPAAFLGDLPTNELLTHFTQFLAAKSIPDQAIALHAANLTHRVQLLRAFADPDAVIEDTCEKVIEISGTFPATAEDIRCGRNPGDVFDPYILAAAQVLMCAGDFEATISATVSHKVLMIIEGLLGHLHEDVIGAMRGNVRVPEPRGRDQETLDPLSHPFPGADIVQPPLATGRPLRFHQVKSKSGSAKGGDGRRLGLQLTELQKFYGGEAFYDALIGNTLRGHRSMPGVLRAAPKVIVLVGEAAFLELTGSPVGPQLLLRLYQSAFDVASRKTGYSLAEVVTTSYLAFRQRAEQLGEGFLESVLHDAIFGPIVEQDSRQFTLARRKHAPEK